MALAPAYQDVILIRGVAERGMGLGMVGGGGGSGGAGSILCGNLSSWRNPLPFKSACSHYLLLTASMSTIDQGTIEEAG